MNQQRHDPYAALRHRDYRLLFLGSILASIGTEMQATAIGWELYRRTNSATALGLIGLVQFIPVGLLSLPAGQAADRYNRRLVFAVAQVAMTMAALGLAELSWTEGPVPWVYACLFLAGTSRAFSAPARWSLVPRVVPERVLSNAITWNASSWQIASMAGPAAAGLLIWATGAEAPAYLLSAACAVFSAGLFVLIHDPGGGRRVSEAGSWQSLLAGIAFVRRSKLILATITLDLFAVLLGGATALLPIYARDILDIGPRGLGWLRAAPSIGAFVMAIGLAHRPPMRRAGRTLLWAVAGFGLATIGFGLSRQPVLSFIMLALTGALDKISMVVRGTLVQVLTPDTMRGRVSAVNAIFIGSSNELGAFESGVTARWFGPVWSVVGGGIGTLLVVLTVMMFWPQVLRLGPLDRADEMRALAEESRYSADRVSQHRE